MQAFSRGATQVSNSGGPEASIPLPGQLMNQSLPHEEPSMPQRPARGMSKAWGLPPPSSESPLPVTSYSGTACPLPAMAPDAPAAASVPKVGIPGVVTAACWYIPVPAPCMRLTNTHALRCVVLCCKARQCDHHDHAQPSFT